MKCKGKCDFDENYKNEWKTPCSGLAPFTGEAAIKKDVLHKRFFGSMEKREFQVSAKFDIAVSTKEN